MKTNSFFSVALCLSTLLLLTTSCKKDVKDQSSQDELLTAAGGAATKLDTDLLKSVRNATSRFHSTTQAINAGYEPSDHCVSAPNLGGMGYHWVNPGLVDPVFDPLKPEAMLYATGPGGNLRLIAVEYIVINIGQPRPMFGDRPFDINGTPIPAPHWSLHVWLYEPNPAGMFTPFNPNVSCP